MRGGNVQGGSRSKRGETQLGKYYWPDDWLTAGENRGLVHKYTMIRTVVCGEFLEKKRQS
jgi:hypothetical protein